tara:strand:- start:2510 stop:3733 length:1224 start_codon:yes stop_codon:yes gene_type:complete
MANGWGQGTWGAVGWGGIGNTSFAVTGVAGTGEIGDEATSGSSVVIETGLQATGSVGTVVASSVHIITPTSVVGTTSVGNVLPKIPITAVVTGLSATTGFLSGWGNSAWGAGVWGGGVFADVGQVIPVSTNVAQGLIQTPTILGDCNFSVTGVAGTSAVGNEVVDAQMKFSATGLSATSAVGNTSEIGSNLVVLTGVSSTILISGYEASTVTKVVTVQSVSSANKYFIDGVQQQTQELFEGNTYYFDQSDSSNNGHPLRFSTTSNGTHGGGSEYTTGVTTYGTPGSSGAYTLITVADKAPTLYYYCTNHSGMGGTANTPAVYSILTSTGAPVTTVVGTMALGSESVIASADIGVTLAGMTISVGVLAISGTSVLSLTGLEATGGTGEEQVYGLITPTQLANWIERAA